MIPSAMQPARPLDILPQKVRSAQYVLKAGRSAAPVNEVADRLRPKTSPPLTSQQEVLHSLVLVTPLTFGRLLQVVEPVEVGPKMAVARQELQDPNPQALVPHLGAQRFQARGEALVQNNNDSTIPLNGAWATDSNVEKHLRDSFLITM